MDFMKVSEAGWSAVGKSAMEGSRASEAWAGWRLPIPSMCSSLLGSSWWVSPEAMSHPIPPLHWGRIRGRRRSVTAAIEMSHGAAVGKNAVGLYGGFLFFALLRHLQGTRG